MLVEMGLVSLKSVFPDGAIFGRGTFAGRGNRPGRVELPLFSAELDASRNFVEVPGIGVERGNDVFGWHAIAGAAISILGSEGAAVEIFGEPRVILAPVNLNISAAHLQGRRVAEAGDRNAMFARKLIILELQLLREGIDFS